MRTIIIYIKGGLILLQPIRELTTVPDRITLEMDTQSLFSLLAGRQITLAEIHCPEKSQKDVVMRFVLELTKAQLQKNAKLMDSSQTAGGQMA